MATRTGQPSTADTDSATPLLDLVQQPSRLYFSITTQPVTMGSSAQQTLLARSQSFRQEAVGGGWEYHEVHEEHEGWNLTLQLTRMISLVPEGPSLLVNLTSRCSNTASKDRPIKLRALRAFVVVFCCRRIARTIG
jgi:hypothetical protein